MKNDTLDDQQNTSIEETKQTADLEEKEGKELIPDKQFFASVRFIDLIRNGKEICKSEVLRCLGRSPEKFMANDIKQIEPWLENSSFLAYLTMEGTLTNFVSEPLIEFRKEEESVLLESTDEFLFLTDRYGLQILAVIVHFIQIRTLVTGQSTFSYGESQLTILEKIVGSVICSIGIAALNLEDLSESFKSDLMVRAHHYLILIMKCLVKELLIGYINPIKVY